MFSQGQMQLLQSDSAGQFIFKKKLKVLLFYILLTGVRLRPGDEVAPHSLGTTALIHTKKQLRTLS